MRGCAAQHYAMQVWGMSGMCWAQWLHPFGEVIKLGRGRMCTPCSHIWAKAIVLLLMPQDMSRMMLQWQRSAICIVINSELCCTIPSHSEGSFFIPWEEVCMLGKICNSDRCQWAFSCNCAHNSRPPFISVAFTSAPCLSKVQTLVHLHKLWHLKTLLWIYSRESTIFH